MEADLGRILGILGMAFGALVVGWLVRTYRDHIPPLVRESLWVVVAFLVWGAVVRLGVLVDVVTGRAASRLEAGAGFMVGLVVLGIALEVGVRRRHGCFVWPWSHEQNPDG